MSWCRHLLVSFHFHALTSLYPLHLIEKIFPLVPLIFHSFWRRAHLHAHAHADNLHTCARKLIVIMAAIGGDPTIVMAKQAVDRIVKHLHVREMGGNSIATGLRFAFVLC